MTSHVLAPAVGAALLVASVCACGGEKPDGDDDAGVSSLDASAPGDEASDAQIGVIEIPSEHAQPDAENDASVRPFRPEELPFSSSTVEALRVPDGFRVSVFASELGNARMLVVGDDGAVYVSRPREGDVLRLRDVDQDGAADEQATIVSDMPGVHGLALHEDKLYVADSTRILAGTLCQDATHGATHGTAHGATLETLHVIDGSLPADGPQALRAIAFGPDRALYVSIAAACEACTNEDAEHATLLRMAPDGSSRSVFASGLRRSEGFAWHPTTHALFATDQGSDLRGYDAPPDELNALERGAAYGWPYCFGDGRVDVVIADPPDEDKDAYCARMRLPALLFPADSTPVSVVFYTGEAFPEAYRGDAFVALRGAWNRSAAGGGFEVVRVRIADGAPLRAESFLSGFLSDDGRTEHGRPAGLAIDRDGALLVSDDRNGVIYRVSHVSHVSHLSPAYEAAADH